MDLEQLLENFSTQLKLDASPEKNPEGVFQLKLPPHFQIGLSKIESGIFLSSLIMPISQEGGKEALFIYLMQANLMNQGTGKGVIGIDPTGKYFTFSQALPFTTDDTLFKETIQDCLNYISYWQEEIIQFNQTFL